MTVLLLGAAGNVGPHVARALLGRAPRSVEEYLHEYRDSLLPPTEATAQIEVDAR